MSRLRRLWDEKERANAEWNGYVASLNLADIRTMLRCHGFKLSSRNEEGMFELWMNHEHQHHVTLTTVEGSVAEKRRAVDIFCKFVSDVHKQDEESGDDE